MDIRGHALRKVVRGVGSSGSNGGRYNIGRGRTERNNVWEEPRRTGRSPTFSSERGQGHSGESVIQTGGKDASPTVGGMVKDPGRGSRWMSGTTGNNLADKIRWQREEDECARKAREAAL